MKFTHLFKWPLNPRSRRVYPFPSLTKLVYNQHEPRGQKYHLHPKVKFALFLGSALAKESVTPFGRNFSAVDFQSLCVDVVLYALFSFSHSALQCGLSGHHVGIVCAHGLANFGAFAYGMRLVMSKAASCSTCPLHAQRTTTQKDRIGRKAIEQFFCTLEPTAPGVELPFASKPEVCLSHGEGLAKE